MTTKRTKTVEPNKWRFPVGVRGKKELSWYYRDRRGFEIVVYPAPDGQPMHVRIHPAEMRKYIKELDAMNRRTNRKGKK